MTMLLMVLAASLFAGAVLSLTFLGVAPRETEERSAQPELELPVGAVRFFGDRSGAVAGPGVPIEVVLSQLERHVRLEQAAAETFLAMPTRERLNDGGSASLIN